MTIREQLFAIDVGCKYLKDVVDRGTRNRKRVPQTRMFFVYYYTFNKNTDF